MESKKSVIMKKSKVRVRSIKELLLDAYIESIIARDTVGAETWRKQLKDKMQK